jgi:beta-mannosidase
LAAEAIPDPFIGKNEADVQWVHSKTWAYKTTFEFQPSRQHEFVDMVFDGLDTFATVKLNGREILK